ncbi:hypothetical protein DFH07DRAFT_763773 [Mycena maculata]|uniref:Uncharacterized protein n=1 Tax=Mycena maculata TaxID=230809 RepID=A0AAD7KI52_9AGAR|nr:hypothetical protein DFH07DRAFT_763773 [Mycena maculata]
MDNNPGHHTRAATRDGRYPAPPPLFAPTNLSFGSIEAGDSEPLTIAPAVRSVAIPAARTTPASAAGSTVTPVTRRFSAARAGEISSEFPSLTGDVDFGVPGVAPAPVQNTEDGDWTPVTRKTSRTHRERSGSNRSRHTHNNNASDSDASESESTVEQATREMSREELATLARRHSVYAAQLRAEMERKSVLESTQENIPDIEGNAQKSDVPENVIDSRGQAPENNGSADEPEQSPAPVTQTRGAPAEEVVDEENLISFSPAQQSRRATVEEVEDEENLISFSPAPGSPFDKGKRPDPGNWGLIIDLAKFSERDLEAQHERLQTYAEIDRVIKEPESPPFGTFVELPTARTSSPRRKSPRKRSKSPRSRKVKGARVETAPPVVLPAEKVEKPTVVEPRAGPSGNVGPASPAPAKSENLVAVPDDVANDDHESKSGLTLDEMYNLLNNRITELQSQGPPWSGPKGRKFLARPTDVRDTRYAGCHTRKIGCREFL